LLTHRQGAHHAPTRARRFGLPNDVVTWRRRVLLFPANLLFFAARLDEAFKLGRAAHAAQREGRVTVDDLTGS
jgi:hypothetical protein